MAEESNTNNQPQSTIDRFVEKAISRKFLAWLTATGLLAFSGNLTSEDWVTITCVYVGTQSVVDAVTKLRGHRES